MSIGHTPGPWKISWGRGTEGRTIRNEYDTLVCYMPDCDGGWEDEEQSDRDALLIAAAPEMKEMLEDVLLYLRSAGDRAKGLQGSIVALLKRTGWRDEG
ncbi:MAG: hypothetical protein IJR14_08265 [Synergistaceae bacterium]|nr:hypothetical protein [Synergistaceae bacterium]